MSNRKKALRKPRSIRKYFLSSIASILLMSVMIMGIIQVMVAILFFRMEKEEMLQKTVYQVSRSVETGSIDLSGKTIEAVNFIAGIAEVNLVVADINGAIVFHTNTSEISVGQVLPDFVMAEIMESGSYSEMDRLNGMLEENCFIYGSELGIDKNYVSGYIVAWANAEDFYTYMFEIIVIYVLSALIVFLMSVFLAVYLTSKIVKPLEKLIAVAKSFGEGDFTARIEVQGDDEITQLSILFNEIASSMETSELAHTNFMGDLAHELRTPMTSIKGFVDALLDGAIPEESRGRYLQIVSDEVGRLSRLTQSMLDISKVESGDFNLVLEDFDIWEVIISVIDFNDKRIKEGKINIVFRGEETVARVNADKDRVFQVVYNLIDNAVKFTEENGEICIKVLVGKSFSTISVRNTGDGISQSEIEQIFRRLYKSDKSRGANKSGSGLGLHISKVLTNLMGGRIWAESDGKTFTEFHFTLPNGTKGRRDKQT